ncbi:uncharacterized protein VTP21DRAFT_3808 [Calcarisporiella thermophila]|uniref:uncharacterized protein n=1 Tax=Calcarisporiella thermophila TaxID=911321 RepID=UPI003741FB76
MTSSTQIPQQKSDDDSIQNTHISKMPQDTASSPYEQPNVFGEGEMQEKAENENVNEDSPPNTAFSKGVMGLLRPLVSEMDLRAVSLRSSQIELGKEMDRLLNELKQLSENTTLQSPPNITAAVQKLTSTRKRLMQVHQTLKTSQERIERMCVALERSSHSKRS